MAVPSSLVRRAVLGAVLAAALVAADRAGRLAAQEVATAGWFQNSYLVDGRVAGEADPIAFDRRYGARITVRDAELAGVTHATGYGPPHFPRPGSPPRPIWHLRVDNAPPTVLCHPDRNGVHDRLGSPAFGRRHSLVNEEIDPWLQAGARVGTWYQGTSMPFSGGVHNEPQHGPTPNYFSFTDVWPRVHPSSVLVNGAGRFGCASAAAMELHREVTFAGALRSVCDFVLAPLVLRFVSELRCEPDLFDSRTDREGWYDDFALGEPNGGSEVSVLGVTYTDSHRFISGVHVFTSGNGDPDCDPDEGCRASSQPLQHPRDYEGPTPWLRRLEAALMHMSAYNNVDASSAFDIVQRSSVLRPPLSAAHSGYDRSEPFGVDPPVGGGAAGYNPRGYVEPFYGVPYADYVIPSNDPSPGPYYSHAYRWGHLLEPSTSPPSLIEHPRAGFDRYIRTAKGPDCIRFLDPLDPRDPCNGGPVDRDGTGLLPPTVARSPNPGSVVRAIEAGATSARGSEGTAISTNYFTGAGFPFAPADGWSWAVANEATAACVYFHHDFWDLAQDALDRAAAARSAANALEATIPALQLDPDHAAAVSAMIEVYYLRKDVLAWEHISDLRKPLQSVLTNAFGAAGYSWYPRPGSGYGYRGNGLVDDQLGPGGRLPSPLPFRQYPPGGPKPSLSVRQTGGPGHNRCYTNFPGYLPPQPGDLQARPSRLRRRPVQVRPAETRGGVPVSGAPVQTFADPALSAALDAAAAGVGVPPFNVSPAIGRSDSSRDYAIGAIDDPGRLAPPVGAAAYDRFVADRAVRRVVPEDPAGPPDPLGRHPGPSAVASLSCPTFESGMFDPTARFSTTARYFAGTPFAGELGSDAQRQAEALHIYEAHSEVIGTVNQWCPPGSGTYGGCDPQADPDWSVHRITTDVAYTASQPLMDLFGLVYTVHDGLDFGPVCQRSVWHRRGRRASSWFGCPPAPLVRDWLVAAELLTGDAPLRAAPPGRPLGPQTAAEWRRVDQTDCAAAGLGNDCAWVVRSGYVQWWGDVFNGKDSGVAFSRTGGCFLTPPGAAPVPQIGEDIGAPSILQPDSALVCYLREPLEEVVLGCDPAEDRFRTPF